MNRNDIKLLGKIKPWKCPPGSDCPPPFPQDLYPPLINMCECLIFKQGIIQPHSEKEIPLHITAECLEEVSTMAYFMIFGSSDAPLVSLMNLS